MNNEAEDRSVAESNSIPWEAVESYRSEIWAEAPILDIRDAYEGYVWESEEEFARDYFSDSSSIDLTEWPFYCIDWKHAARELFHDFSSTTAANGIYVWRN
jgi:antirestriction protein